jgi:tellurite resistance protein TerC
MDLSIPIIVLQLIFLEGILSIDNAAVLGAMVSHLPDDIPITWPKSLQHFGHNLQKVLGNQRTAALRVGLLGAYLGRGLMLFVASLIIQNHWIKLVGAVYLIKLAFDNLGQAEPGECDDNARPVETVNFWYTVLTIELTDLIFSLDNVVAAVSLSKDIWVVFLGVAIGILLMRFAAGWFSYLVEKEPILKNAAYMLVFNIGVELILEDLNVIVLGDWTRFFISLVTILLFVLYAHSPFLQRFRPVLIWIAQGFSNFNEILDWILVPFKALFTMVWRLLRSIFPSRRLPVPEPGKGSNI